ncbi:hypothetical protein, partial [Paraburkholderia diazotrophica]|uniref:hypothetical protein n=1 Tax=Paraburkholderia diazotrophica TaxID=667676 RepID=UPI003175A2F5
EHRKVVHNLVSLLLMQQTQRRQGASCGCSLKTNSRQMWVLDDGARWFFGAAGSESNRVSHRKKLRKV